MKREPEHYPKWLRELLYDPMKKMGRMSESYNPQRNWDTLNKILAITYRIDPKDALLFDMAIEIERNEIARQDMQRSFAKVIGILKNEVYDLRIRIEEIEDNPLSWMKRRGND